MATAVLAPVGYHASRFGSTRAAIDERTADRAATIVLQWSSNDQITFRRLRTFLFADAQIDRGDWDSFTLAERQEIERLMSRMARHDAPIDRYTIRDDQGKVLAAGLGEQACTPTCFER